MKPNDKDPFNDGNKFPNIADVERAYKELMEFNAYHGERAGINEDENAILGLNLSITLENVEPILSAVGLRHYAADEVTEKNADGEPSRQGIYIDEPALFSEFIEANNRDFTGHPDISGLIREVYDNLIKDIDEVSIYKEKQGIQDLEGDSQDMFVKDLADITEILEGVKLEGEQPDYELGKEYAEWAGREDFNDFLKLRRLGLRKKGLDGAKNWHERMDILEAEDFYMLWTALLNNYDNVSHKYIYGDRKLPLMAESYLKEALSTAGAWLDAQDSVSVPKINNFREEFVKIKAHAESLHL